MKKLFQISLVLWLVSSAACQAVAQSRQKTLRVYDGDSPEVQKNLPDSEIIPMDGISVLKIEHTNNLPLEISIWSTTNTAIIKKAESISFDMKYENVSEETFLHTNRARNVSEGTFLHANRARFGFPITVYGQLQFLTYIPPPTLGGDETTNTTPYYYADGASNWKPYEFQVDHAETAGLPTKLELKLSLPGNGTIYLRPLKLSGVAGNWWSPRQSGMVGGAVGIFGGILGCFGGLLGCLAGFGKARKFVLTATKIFIALGMLLALTGIAAIVCGQPYYVWYVFLLPGIILTLVFSLNFPMLQRCYDDLEIRRMASMDAMRG
jgi:hypothetical protein